jgi:hypothetical protein
MIWGVDWTRILSIPALGIVTIPKQIDKPAVVGRESGANRFDRSCVVESSSWTLRLGLFGDLPGCRHLLKTFSKSSLFE